MISCDFQWALTNMILLLLSRVLVSIRSVSIRQYLISATNDMTEIKSLLVILRSLSYAAVKIVGSTWILFSCRRRATSPSRHSFVETTDDASRWVFNFQTKKRWRESVLWIKKLLTVLGLKKATRVDFTCARKQISETVKQRAVKMLKTPTSCQGTVNLSLQMLWWEICFVFCLLLFERERDMLILTYDKLALLFLSIFIRMFVFSLHKIDTSSIEQY